MKKCEVCGETKGRIRGKTGIYKLDLCARHYEQMRLFGKVTNSSLRSNRDPNEIIVREGYAEVIMYNKKCEEVGRAKVDLDDVEIVSRYKWYMDNQGYAVHKSGKYNIKMHRLVTGCKEDLCVDHENHCTSDNRKSNLRVCTQLNNMSNQKMRSTNKSGYTGIIFDNNDKTWVATITVNYKSIYLGRSKDINEVIVMRRTAELEYFGDFRYKEVI